MPLKRVNFFRPVLRILGLEGPETVFVRDKLIYTYFIVVLSGVQCVVIGGKTINIYILLKHTFKQDKISNTNK